ncbi:hypothetical protein EII35_12990 [Arachnia propionica]|uniref:Uncharacterized protein n=1 Tax=Arachnia propionica TaxID=1750 RepID=A0A3P1WR12_9ACTN|nr:hypothetical protein EII35_12990 [Arachnia propionica]
MGSASGSSPRPGSGGDRRDPGPGAPRRSGEWRAGARPRPRSAPSRAPRVGMNRRPAWLETFQARPRGSKAAVRARWW